MRKKLIDYHYEWMASGMMDASLSINGVGLCGKLMCTEYQESLSLFLPSKTDEDIAVKDNECSAYWGYGYNSKTVHNSMLEYEYTPRRQSIVLMICAMHEEI